MRKVFIYMNMSLDGFFCGPNGELDWMLRTPDQELNDDAYAVLGSADTGMIGYPTAVDMIPYWANVEKNDSASADERKLAKVITRQRGIIISNTSVNLDFPNAELLIVKSDNDLIEAVNQLKLQSGKNIRISGGVRTAGKFSRLGLVDELIFIVHPVAIGSGKGLFTDRTNLQLISSKSYASGVARLHYQPRL
jgi:dihydrofolate reductase